MIKLTSFQQNDFNKLISWVDSEELLITIAGTVFSYPLTNEQLQKYLDDCNSHSFNIVDININKVIGHAEILIVEKGICKIDKLLIGEKTDRGKGLGREIIQQLLHYSFNELNAAMVELNVFDWNINAIKCYENCGFQKNPLKTQTFKTNNETWIAFNMTIDKARWMNNQ